MRLVHFRPKKRHSPRRHKSRGRARNPSKRRSYRRNPSRSGGMGRSLRANFSPSALMQVGAVTLGFIGGAKIGGKIYDMAFTSGPLSGFRRFAGLATVVLGAFAASKSKNALAKTASSGVSAAGIYDLIAQNLSSAGLKAVSGDTIDMNGVDLVGEGGDSVYAGGDTIDVSGNMTELVGDDDSDRIYG